MTNKQIGHALQGVILVSMATGFFEGLIGYPAPEGFYTLLGLPFIVFGFWGARRLINS